MEEYAYEQLRYRRSYFLQRLRRWIPPPQIFKQRLKWLFSFFRNQRDSKTVKLYLALFVGKWRTLSYMQKKGCLGDVPGVCIYYDMGEDSDGLRKCRCARGTNSSEGIIHQKIQRQFFALNAGPQLTYNGLGSFCHRTNISSSSRKSPGYIFYGNYSVWLIKNLGALTQKIFGSSLYYVFNDLRKLPIIQDPLGYRACKKQYNS